MLYQIIVTLVISALCVGCAEEPDFIVRDDAGVEMPAAPYRIQNPFPLKVWIQDDVPEAFSSATIEAISEVNEIARQQVFVLVPSWGESNIVVKAFDLDGVYAQAPCTPGSCDVLLERTLFQRWIEDHSSTTGGRRIVMHEFLHVLGYRGDNVDDPFHDTDGLMGGPVVTDDVLRPVHVAFLQQLKSYVRPTSHGG